MANGTALAKKATARLANREEITLSEAFDFARRLADERLAADRAEATSQREAAETAVGGQVTAFDASVIAQGRQFMQRLAFLARNLDEQRGNNSYSYGSSKSGDVIRKIVPKMAAIIGELEAIQLTDPTIGLFKTVNERDYKIESYQMRPDEYEAGDEASSILDSFSHLPDSVRETIEAALAGKTLVAEPEKPPAPTRESNGSKRRNRERVDAAAASAQQDREEADAAAAGIGATPDDGAQPSDEE